MKFFEIILPFINIKIDFKKAKFPGNIKFCDKKFTIFEYLIDKISRNDEINLHILNLLGKLYQEHDLFYLLTFDDFDRNDNTILNRSIIIKYLSENIPSFVENLNLYYNKNNIVKLF